MLGSLANFVSDIRSWMIANKLKINYSKTEFFLMKLNSLKELKYKLANLKPVYLLLARVLELCLQIILLWMPISATYAVLFIFTSPAFAQHVILLLQLLLSSLCTFLVTSRLDRCNPLLLIEPHYKVKSLQRIYNTAARIFELVQCLWNENSVMHTVCLAQ